VFYNQFSFFISLYLFATIHERHCVVSIASNVATIQQHYCQISQVLSLTSSLTSYISTFAKYIKNIGLLVFSPGLAHLRIIYFALYKYVHYYYTVSPKHDTDVRRNTFDVYQPILIICCVIPREKNGVHSMFDDS